MSLPQTEAWMRRANFPASSQAPLGFPGELWDTNPANYQGAVQLAGRLQELGRKETKRWLAYALAGFLLDDVLVAAGGVEVSILRLRNAVDRTRAYVAENSIQPLPDVPFGIAHFATIEAWYAFADLLIWTRAVEERIQRAGHSRSGVKAVRQQGLLPALKPKRLKKRIESVFDIFRTNPAIESARQLCNFTLHGSLVRHPSSGATLRSDGTLRLPVPDPPSGPVDHWYILTWKEGRDGVQLANAMWEAVQGLIDGILDAFERGVPKRLRVPD